MSTARSTATDHPPRRLNAWLILLLIVVAAWTGREVPSFGYALLLDDDTNLLFNPHLGELDRARLQWMFTDLSYVPRYMPLGWLSFNVVTTGSGLSPFACHLAGVIFHALNSVLVFVCLQRLIARFSPSSSPIDDALAAGLGALLWAVHPLRVESVAWCSGLIYVEGGFFAMVSCYARLRELAARTEAAGRPRWWFGIAVSAFALSLLTYPVALFLPGALLVLDYAWLRKESSALRGSARRELGILMAMSGVALWATLHASNVVLESGMPSAFGVGPRALQAGYVWASYLWRTIWPAHLTPVVEALFEFNVRDVRIWAPFPTLILISWLVWKGRRAAPYLAACWVAYLLSLIPVLGLTQYPHVTADRYSYLVSVLFSVVLVFGLLQVRSRSARAGLFLLGAVIAAIASALSVKQAQRWRDALTMHHYVLTQLKDPDLVNITRARIGKLLFLAGDVRDGRALTEKVYAEAPGIAGVEHVWLELRPTSPLAPDVAARPMQEWRAAPLAHLHDRIARENLSVGRTNDGLVRLNAALAWSPQFVEARFRRALVLAELGRGRAALHDWLVVEAQDNGRAVARDGMHFAALQIATALRAEGDAALALALQRRVSGN